MEIVACKSCGRLFNYIQGMRVCPTCVRKMEDKFVKVKKYVRENPHVGIHELSQEMEVSVSQINRWVREERLVFSDDSPVGIPCESCGATIKTGRFCESCKMKLSNGLRSASGLDRKKEPEAKKKRSTSDKMRFLDN